MEQAWQPRRERGGEEKEAGTGKGEGERGGGEEGGGCKSIGPRMQ